MRIGKGRLKGSRLRAAGDATRPPLAALRASLLDALGGRLPGARVLDLYAGSGSLGLEALSRGAAEAVFMERDPAAAAGIGAAAARMGLESRVHVVTTDTARGVAALAADDRVGFDVVFLDPPFRDDAGAVAAAAAGLVRREGILLWRVARGRPLPGALAGLSLRRQRRHGISVVGFYSS